LFSADLEPTGCLSRYFSVDEHYYAHYKKLEKLHAAATAGGCPLCALLWTRFSANLGVKWDQDLAHTTKRRRRGRAPLALGYLLLNISQSNDRSEHGYYLLNFEFRMHDDTRNHWWQLCLVPVTGG
jgi:hypothetical protein